MYKFTFEGQYLGFLSPYPPQHVDVNHPEYLSTEDR